MPKLFFIEISLHSRSWIHDAQHFRLTEFRAGVGKEAKSYLFPMLQEPALVWSLGFLNPVNDFLGQFVIFGVLRKRSLLSQSMENNTHFQGRDEN